MGWSAMQSTSNTSQRSELTFCSISDQICQVETFSHGHMLANLHCNADGKEDSVSLICFLGNHVKYIFFLILKRGIPMWICTTWSSCSEIEKC